MLAQSIIGTAFNSGYVPPPPIEPAWVDLTGNPNLNAGIVRRDYNQGYFADDTTWFDSRSPSSTSFAFTIDIGQELNTPVDVNNYSIQWTGYFVPPSNGTYIFRTYSDDASYFWIGLHASVGYTTGNAAVNNGGAHGPKYEQSVPFSLTSSRYYPIRAQYGEAGGGAEMRVEYSTDGGINWTIINNMIIVNNYSSGMLPFMYATQLMNLDGASYSSGNTWTDSIGSKAFTLQNSPTWSATNGGQFRFEAANSQYATLDEGAGFNTLPSWSIQSLIKLSSIPNSGAPCIITEYWQRAGQTKINFAQGCLNTTPNLQGGFFDSGAGFWNVSNAVASPSTDTWYDIVTTYDGPTHTLKQYVNGIYIGATSCPGTPESVNPGIVIAKRWDTTDFLDCTIKAINLWQGVLLPEEVTHQHNLYTLT